MITPELNLKYAVLRFISENSPIGVLTTTQLDWVYNNWESDSHILNNMDGTRFVKTHVPNAQWLAEYENDNELIIVFRVA